MCRPGHGHAVVSVGAGAYRVASGRRTNRAPSHVCMCTCMHGRVAPAAHRPACSSTLNLWPLLQPPPCPSGRGALVQKVWWQRGP